MQSLIAPIVLAIAALPASGAVFQYCAGVATDKAPSEAFLSPLRGFRILDDAYRGLPAPANILTALRA